MRIRLPLENTNGVNVDNYRLIMVDFKNVGYQDDPWVLADRVTQVFYVLNPKTGKHVVISRKQKIVGVENVEDNDEDVNQFEEMSLFTNLMNIKCIEKDWQVSFALYTKRWQRKICMIYQYEKICILMLIFMCMKLN
jgi:hypothetical protein